MKGLGQGMREKGGDLKGLNAILEPGMLVAHPDCPEWGPGQVQSRIGNRITVNFREMGKVVVDGSRVGLVLVSGQS